MRNCKSVAVLFARENSIYKSLPRADVFDLARDARTFTGGKRVVAHPPCRAWGRLRTFAKPRADEKDLALFAVAAVRKNGGVLEHPASSTLWADDYLPEPGCGRDAWGGWSMSIPQFWFGHRAEKLTWLYVVGCAPGQVPAVPFVLGEPQWAVERMGRGEREATPVAFAEWLVELATRCKI